MRLREILQHLLTESDNITHDLYRYLSVLTIVTGLGLQVYAIGWKGQPFDMQTFGVGVGALFAGVGVALGLKKETEPDKEPP